jgi:hypothetical protein
MKEHIEIWNNFCTSMNIIDNCVPLFEHINNTVNIKTIGLKTERSMLCRSSMMEKLIQNETDKLILDWEEDKDNLDGLIYMMFIKEGDKVLPLYIGKTETIGKGDRNLSVNIKNLHGDSSKFARWGDGYSYHIGDLSAVVLTGHNENKINKKYTDWANILFVDFPSVAPKLKQEVYFWTTAWSKSNIGIWKEFGQTRLTFLEYLMIGVASSAFPDLLLNREGQNRG